ncbi:GlxA family transcriptional regulator [Jatrophihabitans sp. YIM 134969]
MHPNPSAERHTVVALVLPGVIPFDLAIPAQAFGQLPEHYRFEVCGVEPGPVPTTAPFAVTVGAGLDLLAEADTVVVPGFRPLDRPPPAALAALREAHARGARVASVCVGAFALAAAGLLDGRTATTHWKEAEHLRERFPAVRVNADVLYVDNGRVLTSAGLSAGVDLCLHMIRADLGAAAAAWAARQLVVAAHRPGGQAQFATQVADDDGLSETFDWLVAEMHRPLTVSQMARHAGMPERSFARHFKLRTNMTPTRWLTTQRVLEVQRLLETTELSVEEIASRTGLGTGTSLRSQLARHLGTTPTAYRRAHRRQLTTG